MVWPIGLLVLALASGCESSPSTPTSAPGDEARGALETRVSALTADCNIYVVDGYDKADYKAAWCTGTPEGAGDPVPVSVFNVNGKPIEVATGNAYFVMATAAANDPTNPVVFNLEVGMRTMEKQMEHWQCFQCYDDGTPCWNCTYDVGQGPKPCGSCNPAACPGKSNHQMGIAVDITTGCNPFLGDDPPETMVANCKAQSPAYKWLLEHANSYGFYNTYFPEPWHWVYQPEKNPGPGGGPCGAGAGCESQCLPLNANGDSTGILNPDCTTTACGFLLACTEAFGAPECISAFCNDGVDGITEGYQCFSWGDHVTCNADGSVADLVDCPAEAPCTPCGTCGGDCGISCDASCLPAGPGGTSSGILNADCSETACESLETCAALGGAPTCVSSLCVDDQGNTLQDNPCLTESSYVDCGDPTAPEVVSCGWLDLCHQPASGDAQCVIFGCLDNNGQISPGHNCVNASTSFECDESGALVKGTDCPNDDCNACGTCGAAPTELCNGLDEDCDDAIDEGVTNACGSCGDVPQESCNGLDDDCDGDTDEGVTNACGSCGAVPDEDCNGLDDDCDGAIDEGVANACGSCGELPDEDCNGLDDDCDGAIDEGCPEAPDAQGDGGASDAEPGEDVPAEDGGEEVGPTADVTDEEVPADPPGDTAAPQPPGPDSAPGQETEASVPPSDFEPDPIDSEGSSKKSSGGCSSGSPGPSWLLALAFALFLGRGRRLLAPHRTD